MLTRLVGPENYHTTVQAIVEGEEVVSMSIAVVIDKEILSLAEGASFQNEIERQLTAIVAGYGFHTTPAVDFIPFDKKRKVWIEHKERGSTSGLLFTLFFVSAAIIASFLLLRKYKKKPKQNDEEDLFRLMTRMDLKKLGQSIQQEDPQTIALMLSYLDPTRAEQMIAALNSELQEEVLFHLSELEGES